MDLNYQTWLKSLKIGDKVILEKNNYGDISLYYTEVSHITPKRNIRVKFNESYMFKDGETGRHPKIRIKEITPELINEKKIQTQRANIRTFGKWDSLSSEKIDQIHRILFPDVKS